MNIVGYALPWRRAGGAADDEGQDVAVGGTVTKTTGAHNLKIGGGVVLREFSVLQSISPVGVLTFNSLGDQRRRRRRRQHRRVVPARLPVHGRARAQPVRALRTTRTSRSAYVQDDWRATSWLTVNLGAALRHLHAVHARRRTSLSNFDPAAPHDAGRGGEWRVGDRRRQDRLLATSRRGSDSRRRCQRRWCFAAATASPYFPGNIASPSYLKNPPFTANYGPVVSTAASGLAPNVRLADGLPPLANNSVDNLSGALIATALDFKSNRSSSST